MDTSSELHATEQPIATPPRRITLRHVGYIILVLTTSSLAFGPWLRTRERPHLYVPDFDAVVKATDGLLFSLGVMAFWWVVWGFGFHRRSFIKTACGALVLFTFFAISRPYPSSHGGSRGYMCINHLKQIGLAFHNYHDKYGSFPPAYVSDKTGKPMHSWRVLLLPFLGYGEGYTEKYERYNFDKPWNDETNQQLTSRVPDPYSCPSTVEGNPSVMTSYLAVVGPGTVWPEANSTKIADITDGLDQTVMIIELPGHEVPWMEPRDISFDDAMQLLADHPARNTDGEYFNYHLLMADGSVRTMPVEAPAAWWKAWFTVAGNDESPDLTTMPRKSTSDIRHVLRHAALATFIILTLLPVPWVWCRR